MSDPVDPGDPFTPGTLRFEARRKLLVAVEDVIEHVGEIGTPEWAERWQLLVAAHRRWALYGRDGE